MEKFIKEIGRYRSYEEDGLFKIYSVISEVKSTCTNLKTAEYIATLLKNDDEIFDEARRLNKITEPVRDRSWKNLLPKNDNRKHLVLESPLAKATRELLQKQK